ncbi:PilT/PilU family type 4a pilus ATPase [bacterium]|nr:PilT/PilU family type 4a pilus ATPase [bacterium]
MDTFDINGFLKEAYTLGVSDVHLQLGGVPVIRKDGEIKITNMPKITTKDMEAILTTIVPSSLKNRILGLLDVDFAYEIPDVSRFRVNFSKHMGRIALTIRVIPLKIPTLKELQLPDTLEKIASLNSGIVLITGVAGSGKTTTIASILEFINNNYAKHIITVEDPVEYVFTDKKSLFSQRQVELDTASFNDGLKYALRQDPNVIVIGEVRDEETVLSAIRAAETGHLVIATMHTIDAAQTVNRVLSFFDPAARENVKQQFADLLMATFSQKLLPRKDGKGRVPAYELMMMTPTIKDFILKDELEQVYQMVKKGGHEEMITFNMCLLKLLEQNLITDETAMNASTNKVEMGHYIKGVFHGAFNNGSANLQTTLPSDNNPSKKINL